MNSQWVTISVLKTVPLIFCTQVFFRFVLCNDSWSQEGHSVSCMTILFLNLQFTRSDIRPHLKLAVSLVIAYGYFNIPQGFVWVCMG